MSKWILLLTLFVFLTSDVTSRLEVTSRGHVRPEPGEVEEEEGRPLNYGPSFLRDLCRYVGAPFIRHPADPECKYLWCWYGPGFAFPMDCPPGRMVNRHFYWGRHDPCSEWDSDKRCLLGQMEFTEKKEQLAGTEEPVGTDDTGAGGEGKIFHVAPVEDVQISDETTLWVTS